MYGPWCLDRWRATSIALSPHQYPHPSRNPANQISLLSVALRHHARILCGARASSESIVMPATAAASSMRTLKAIGTRPNLPSTIRRSAPLTAVHTPTCPPPAVSPSYRGDARSVTTGPPASRTSAADPSLRQSPCATTVIAHVRPSTEATYTLSVFGGGVAGGAQSKRGASIGTLDRTLGHGSSGKIRCWDPPP